LLNTITDHVSVSDTQTRSPRLWIPERVLFTPAALDEDWEQQILRRVQSLNLPIKELSQNRLKGLRGESERDTYNIAKRTLAVVTAPPSSFKLSPIPPSADWQFHIAEGCPAHCQYCYLAGSLSGPPVIRVFANLPHILENRFTPGSKEVLQTWYPQSKLEMNEAKRSVKRNKFGGMKYVYDRDTMKALRCFFESEITKRFPNAEILYWT